MTVAKSHHFGSRLSGSVILLTVFCVLQVYSQLDNSKEYSKENVKTFIENTAKYHFAGLLDREAFRNQMKVLAITVFFTLVGISLSRTDKNQRRMGIIIAFTLETSLYVMDTSLLDLNGRQTAFTNKMDEHLLRWDTMNMAQVDSALADAKAGVSKSDPYKKIVLALTPRLNDWLWYGFPMVCVPLILWVEKNKTKVKK